MLDLVCILQNLRSMWIAFGCVTKNTEVWLSKIINAEYKKTLKVL